MTNLRSDIARGLVLRQSLHTESLPESLKRFVVDEHRHLLGGKKPVDVLILKCVRQELWPILERVAQLMKKRRFYAHFVFSDVMYIVFPSSIVFVDRDDEASARRAREFGAVFDIPAIEMKFEKMFEVDHPNVTE